MTPGEVRVVDLDEAAAREVQELAAAAGVAVVTRNGKIAYCNARNIPDGWSAHYESKPHD